jgi:hypothetical protein
MWDYDGQQLFIAAAADSCEHGSGHTVTQEVRFLDSLVIISFSVRLCSITYFITSMIFKLVFKG